LNDALFGLHPWGWHLTSVLAHVATTWLVYRLALRITRDAWVAGTAALIFGLHPVHVEAVADITSIQEPLSTFFILAALLAFARSQEEAKGRWLTVSLGSTVAALLTKESGMVLPVLVGAYAWIFDGDGRDAAPAKTSTRRVERMGRALVASIPYWLVVLVYVPLRVHALKGFAHVITPLSLRTEILTLPSVLVFYVRVLFWPAGLSCYYDTPYVTNPGWRSFGLPVMLLAAIVAELAVWYARVRRSSPEAARVLQFAYVWMALTIVPVLNLRYFPAGEIAHDRYVYLPSVGFAILVGMALKQLAARAKVARPAWSLAGASLLAVALGGLTQNQSLYWADDLILNYRAHKIAPHNVSATTSLAAAVAARGMDGPAMELYQDALNVQPNFWRANVNLAYLYYAHGNNAEAVRLFARACAADPTDGDQFLYLGMALLRMGQLDQAEKAVRSALQVRPQGKNYHLGLGMVLKAEGKFPEAAREVQTELIEDPRNAQARSLLDEITRRMQDQPQVPVTSGLSVSPGREVK
jgi:Tfp pilus assembly protein PilF